MQTKTVWDTDLHPLGWYQADTRTRETTAHRTLAAGVASRGTVRLEGFTTPCKGTCAAETQSSHSTPGYLPTRNENICLYKNYTRMLAAGWFVIAQTVGNPNVPQEVNSWKLLYPCKGTLLGSEKELAIYWELSNMVESRNNFTEWNKPGKKEDTPYKPIFNMYPGYEN